MKNNRSTLILMALMIALIGVGGSWATAYAGYASERELKVTAGKPADLYLGRAGVFTPSSVYSGKLVLTRTAFDYVHAGKNDPFFRQQWIDVRLYDTRNVEIEKARGLVYVYFNLTSSDLDAWEDEDLSIYFWDEVKKEWVKSFTFLVDDDSAKYGRAATVISRFGLYTLGSE